MKLKICTTQFLACLTLTVLGVSSVISAQEPMTKPETLRGRKVPEPSKLGDFIRDKQAAIAIGKALFWDMQVGSDNMTSCASCHFHAGADNRAKIRSALVCCV